MDHRKLLVVILSVTLFAALVLGISLLALYPGGDGTSESVQTADSRHAFDPIEYVRSSDGPLGIVEDEESDDEGDEDGDVVIVYGSRQEEADTDADRDDAAGDDDAAADDAPVARTTPAPQDDEPSARATEPAREPAPVEQPPRTPSSTPPTEPRPASTQAAAASEADDEYWIQVVSSPNRDTVEQARATLEERSLGSVIFPIEIAGRRFYRLRVGPYSDRQEADKFLVWIRELPGFAESYVSVVFRA